MPTYHLLSRDTVIKNRERIRFLYLIIGIVTPFALSYNFLKQELLSSYTPQIILCICAYFLSVLAIEKSARFNVHKERPLFLFIPLSGLLHILVLGTLAFLKLDYSRLYIFLSFIITAFSIGLMIYIKAKLSNPTIALIQTGNTYGLSNLKSINVVEVSKPEQLTSNINADIIAADMHTISQDSAWVEQLSTIASSNIPLHNSATLYEALTGKVVIENIEEIHLEEFRINTFYSKIKRVLEVIFIILTAPFTASITLLTALAIKLESKGPIIFTQKRTGLNNKEFTMYKLRSMCKNSEDKGSQFAQKDDMRVTKVGKLIRKTRIDELPQLWNILKGDMSLIGPRPEQVSFTNQFANSISFYNYRHLVKPGITGWAQVTQGYVASEDETKEKLARDLFYIKHYSPSLDFYITLKTIATMIFGFGAR